MILHRKETAIRVRKKHCDVSGRMYYLKFTFKRPEYTRNIVFLWFSCRFSQILKN